MSWRESDDGGWLCEHGTWHRNGGHRACDGCCNREDYPGLPEHRAKVMANFSALATCRPPRPDKIREAVGPIRHREILHRRGVEFNSDEAKEAYNFDVMGMQRLAIPAYKRALVVGAGPSMTREAFDREAPEHDLILITQPMVRGLQDLLDRDGVYVVDAERDWFIIPVHYGDLTPRMRYICKSDRHLDASVRFRELWGVPAWMKPALSSGALALQVAWDHAHEVTALGIDLSGHYEKFTAETLPLMVGVSKR